MNEQGENILSITGWKVSSPSLSTRAGHNKQQRGKIFSASKLKYPSEVKKFSKKLYRVTQRKLYFLKQLLKIEICKLDLI